MSVNVGRVVWACRVWRPYRHLADWIGNMAREDPGGICSYQTVGPGQGEHQRLAYHLAARVIQTIFPTRGTKVAVSTMALRHRLTLTHSGPRWKAGLNQSTNCTKMETLRVRRILRAKCRNRPNQSKPPPILFNRPTLSTQWRPGSIRPPQIWPS
uniref:Uncharacterized protein n=1 Tax=Cacopsylla melanoneura TaxID=428564 RepID=A0A8D9BK50_9HEMI